MDERAEVEAGRRAGARPGERRILFSILTALLVLLALEAGTRVLLAFRVGPSVLLYGTHYNRHEIKNLAKEEHWSQTGDPRSQLAAGSANHTVRWHENEGDGYSKYFPHQVRYTYDVDTGETFPVTINARGFRGREIDAAKAPGVVRVVTLGASSTFGYHDRDDETYPVHLEQLLNQRCRSGARYEVINLGIPDLDSSQILALFRAEGLPLDPDVVTFYEGFNDGQIHNKGYMRGSVLDRGYKWVRDHVIVVGFASSLLTGQIRRFSEKEVARHIAGRPERFVENLASMREECDRRGIPFIIGSQQARSLSIPRGEIRGVTYDQEVERVRRELRESGSVNKDELQFLAHDAVTKAEARWARETGATWVDVRAALDGDRDTVVSWVHLSDRGNRIVAEQFAGPILARTCGAGVLARRGDGASAQ